MLAPEEELLLFELYGITTPGTAIPIGEVDVVIQNQLMAAIASINSDVAKVLRVQEILSEYTSIALDPSPIEREGYSFRLNRNLDHIKRLLYSYTAIPLRKHNLHRINLG